MKRIALLLLFALLLPTGLLAQGTVFQATDRFQSSRSSQCYDLTRNAAAANYFLMGWRVIGTVSGGTIKVQQSASNDCSNLSDLIADADATANGQSAVTQGTPGSIKVTVTSYAGTGTVASWVGAWVSNPAASGTLSGDVTVTDGVDSLAIDASGQIACSNCGAGTQYTEDAAAAANPLGTALSLVRVDTPAGQVSANGDNVAARGTNFGALYTTQLDSAGAEVVPLTTSAHDAAFGTAGSADAQVRSIQGVASMTPVQIAASNGDAITANTNDCEGNALSDERYISAGATEDENEIKATAGTLCSIIASNSHATAAAYIKCTNLTAANTTPGTSTIVFDFMVPAASTAGVVHIDKVFSTAITCYIVLGKTDAAVDEVAANDVRYTVTYK